MTEPTKLDGFEERGGLLQIPQRGRVWESIPSIREVKHDFAPVISSKRSNQNLCFEAVHVVGPAVIRSGLVMQWADPEKQSVKALEHLHYPDFAGIALTNVIVPEGYSSKITMVVANAVIRFSDVLWGDLVSGGEAQMNFLMIQLAGKSRFLKFR